MFLCVVMHRNRPVIWARKTPRELRDIEGRKGRNRRTKEMQREGEEKK